MLVAEAALGVVVVDGDGIIVRSLSPRRCALLGSFSNAFGAWSASQTHARYSSQAWTWEAGSRLVRV